MVRNPCITCKGKGYVKVGEGPKADYAKCHRCRGAKTEFGKPAPSVTTSAHGTSEVQK